MSILCTGALPCAPHGCKRALRSEERGAGRGTGSGAAWMLADAQPHLPDACAGAFTWGEACAAASRRGLALSVSRLGPFFTIRAHFADAPRRDEAALAGEATGHALGWPLKYVGLRLSKRRHAFSHHRRVDQAALHAHAALALQGLCGGCVVRRACAADSALSSLCPSHTLYVPSKSVSDACQRVRHPLLHIDIISVLRFDQLRVYNSRLHERDNGARSVLGVGSLLGSAALPLAIEAGCTRAELLAINNTDWYRDRLVKFYG